MLQRRLLMIAFAAIAIAIGNAGLACVLTEDFDAYSKGAAAGGPVTSEEAGNAQDARAGNGLDGNGSTSGGDGPASDIAAKYSAAVMADQPKLYARLDDATGEVAHDSSGQSHDGAMFGKYSWGAPGMIGTGLTLEKGRIDYDSLFDFIDTQPYSLEVWIKPTVIDDVFRHVFIKDWRETAATREEYGVYVQDTDLVTERYTQGDAHSAGILFSDRINQWSHVVSTFDGERITLYVNGESVDGTRDGRGQAPKPVGFIVGAHDRQNGGGFIGTLDEVAVYDKALTQDRVKAHFDAAK